MRVSPRPPHIAVGESAPPSTTRKPPGDTNSASHFNTADTVRDGPRPTILTSPPIATGTQRNMPSLRWTHCCKSCSHRTPTDPCSAGKHRSSVVIRTGGVTPEVGGPGLTSCAPGVTVVPTRLKIRARHPDSDRPILIPARRDQELPAVTFVFHGISAPGGTCSPPGWGN